MFNNYERIAYWLLPEVQYIRKLEEIINALAAKYNGPIFQPHLTIGVGNYQSQAEVEIVFNSLLIEARNFSLISSGFDFEDSYTKSFYIKFKEDPTVFLLSKEVANRIPNGNEYQFDPHLSLFYGQISAEERSRIFATILLPQLVKFSDIVAMGIPRSNQSKSDVESWVKLAKRSF